MKTDKLLSFIFSIKKSNFEITPEELKKITDLESFINQKKILDLDILWEDEIENNPKKILLAIFEEAKKKKPQILLGMMLYDYEQLTTFNDLLKRSLEFRLLFLHYHILEIKKENNGNDTFNGVHIRFQLRLLNYLLDKDLPLTEKDFIILFNFWNTVEYYSSHFSLDRIISLLHERSKQKEISKEFYNFLRFFISSNHVKKSEYKEYQKQVANIERILLDHYTIKSDKVSVVFLLLPDHFGVYTNQLIAKLDDAILSPFSKILMVLSKNKGLNTPPQLFYTIEKEFSKIHLNTYKKLVRELLERASNFKPKVKPIYRNTYYRNNFYFYDYEPMRKENILIIKGLVLSAAFYKDVKSIPFIQLILERSYSSTNAIKLGPTSRALGAICIQVLAHHFDLQGQKLLVDVYHQTKFKLIKKQIEKESKKIFQHTGQPLL
ncbi:hypothetical protein ATE84_5227 [Aquimarina sp. MAR_2010_214]|uniref:hypothetical protein n=1 Tax=Aquimarina sp. MAR_2010_214 TaxID=1250026 RepID=UPI000C701066|nr:hypothetical protein [Aquimarina sp. MAR_2010_214]PKV53092.1 hypothetical protein ATE84_5227 [Aquimarina sp. MAR_2010_214]